MTEIRCRKCNRKLFEAAAAYIEIKCPKCGLIQSIVYPDVSGKADKVTIPIFGKELKEVRIELI